jgi:hypothetical protein
MSELLQALRSEGAQRLDPVRFHYLEVLQQRLPGAPDEVRRILQGKLDEALADYAERFRQSQTHALDDAARPCANSVPAAAIASPLAELTRHLHSISQQAPEPSGTSTRLGDEAPDPSEMKSLRRFREAWSKIAAQDQVDKAIGRGPENAGPLNSHLLALRSLRLMRDLSPDYLQRFLVHLEALQWLDQANQPRRSKKEK